MDGLSCISSLIFLGSVLTVVPGDICTPKPDCPHTPQKSADSCSNDPNQLTVIGMMCMMHWWQVNSQFSHCLYQKVCLFDSFGSERSKGVSTCVATSAALSSVCLPHAQNRSCSEYALFSIAAASSLKHSGASKYRRSALEGAWNNASVSIQVLIVQGLRSLL